MTWTGRLLAAAAALGLSALALPASAHPVVVGSAPSDGARVAQPPTQVRIRFSEPVTPLEVSVVDPSGEDLSAGPPEQVEDTVVQPLRPFRARGEHRVRYQVIAADDHITEGGFTFRYTGPVETAPEPEDDAASPAGPQPGASPGLPRTQDPSPAEQPAPAREPPLAGQPTPGAPRGAPQRSVWPLAVSVSLATILAAGTVRTVRSISGRDRR